jgi:hypothetical protein
VRSRARQDLAWPFAVYGQIDDETLISLVTFVRSRPAIPDISEGQSPEANSERSLSGVWRQGGQFFVGLRLREEAEGLGSRVIRNGTQWVVTDWRWSIV